MILELFRQCGIISMILELFRQCGIFSKDFRTVLTVWYFLVFL